MAYCEHCEQEYAGTLCPVCGALMLQEVDPESMVPEAPEWSFSAVDREGPVWPLASDGAPEAQVRLLNCADYPSEEEILVARLKAAGIPVLVRYPKAGALGKLYWGFSTTGADLYIPKSRLGEARTLLKPAVDAEKEEQT